MARFHCRCRKCDARKVLKYHPDTYDVQPQCKCGARNFRIDKWMNNRDTSKTVCTCAGYHFWHRMGSLYCWHRKDKTERFPGDPDFWDRNMTQEEHDALVEAKRAEIELV